MELKLAEKNNLRQLKKMYEKIIDNMNRNGIEIWDEIYPCEFFEDDIVNKRLYLLTKGNDIAGAFVLCGSNPGEGSLKWKTTDEKALYIDRFGVNTDCLRQGTGSLMLDKAAELAKQKGVKYLRLFVVDINKPAISLYLKNGFKQVEGIYEERIDDVILYEYGFEKEIL